MFVIKLSVTRKLFLDVERVLKNIYLSDLRSNSLVQVEKQYDKKSNILRSRKSLIWTKASRFCYS